MGGERGEGALIKVLEFLKNITKNNQRRKKDEESSIDSIYTDFSDGDVFSRFNRGI
jgi:hypothetical protein